jgi:TP901 family phage tail tape measure protein
MAKRFTIEAVFKAIDRITVPVTRMQNRIGKFTRSFAGGLKSVDRAVSGFTQGLRRMAIIATIAFAATGAAMADVIRTGAKFEQSLVNASARFGDIKKGSEAFKALEDAAREVGRTTEFTASQAAQGLNILATAGFNAEAAMAALPSVIDLATASQTGLAEASRIAIKTLGAFGLRTKDPIQQVKNLAKVNDFLVKTSTSASLTIQELFESIRSGAPFARAAGQTMEEFGTLVALMADRGTEGSIAGRQLTRMFLNMSDPSEKARKIMRALKVDFKDANGEFKKMGPLFGEINEGLKGVARPDKIAILKEIFGVIGGKAALQLMDAGEKGIDDFSKKFENFGGTAKKMAAIMRDTLSGRFKELASAVESVKLAIFGEAEDEINAFTKALVSLIRTSEKFVKGPLGGIMKFLFSSPKLIIFLTAGVIGLTASFIGLIIALKVLILVMAVLNLSPIVLTFTIAVIAFAGALVFMIGILAATVIWFEEWTHWLRNSSDAFKILILLAALLTGPFFLLIAVAALLIAHWEGLSIMAEEVFTDMFLFIDKWVGKAADVFMDAWEGVSNFIKKIWDNIKIAVKAGIDFIMAGFNKFKIFALKAELLITFNDSAADKIRRQIEILEGGGGGGGEGAVAGGIGGIINGTEGLTREIRENRTTNSSELTIRDETGRAELSGAEIPGLTLRRSGDF